MDKHKIILWILFLIFAIITAVGLFHHECWFDEAQAWLIAKNLNFFELLKQMKYEGHLFVWFTLLMPFAKLNIPYPLPMQIINMLCMWGAVYVLLKKAPFNPILKTLIVFSAPVCYMYAVIARCYSCGILLLFLLAALYKDKLKHPYLYAVLIALCANTSVMALFGAAAFGALFIFDYIKSKPEFYKSKEFYILAFIAIFTAGIICYQLLGAQNQTQTINTILRQVQNKFLFLTQMTFNGLWLRTGQWVLICTSLLTFIYITLSIWVLKSDKKSLFFFLTTYFLMFLLLANFYNGFEWHHFFIFIYFVIALWLYFDTDPKTSAKTVLLTSFFVIILLRLDYVSYLYYHSDISMVLTQNKNVAEKIASDDKISKGNIVVCDEQIHGVIPYLADKGISVYECSDKDKINHFVDRSLEYSIAVKSRFLVPEKFKKFEDKDIYLIAENNIDSEFFSDYYKLELEFCALPAPNDNAQICVIKMVPGYQDEQ